jgi:guanylate kinase
MSLNSISLVISAPSGTGKTTLIRKLMESEPRLVFSVSTTTRHMRKGEIEGKSYYFIDDETFKEMAKKEEFVEWAKVYDHSYGTSKKEIDRIRAEGNIPIFDVDVQGAKNLRLSLHDSVLVFIMPPSVSALVDRLTKRNTESKKELSLRLSKAIGEMREYEHYDYIVINDRIEDAVCDLKAIIRSEMISQKRMDSVVRKILEDAK